MIPPQQFNNYRKTPPFIAKSDCGRAFQFPPGWFNATKSDLDHIPAVAFLHMDMDIYPAALEILEHFVCRMRPNTVLVFDELINYPGWHADGEYKALEEVSTKFGLVWEFAGWYYEQSVVVVVRENRGLGCY